MTELSRAEILDELNTLSNHDYGFKSFPLWLTFGVEFYNGGDFVVEVIHDLEDKSHGIHAIYNSLDDVKSFVTALENIDSVDDLKAETEERTDAYNARVAAGRGSWVIGDNRFQNLARRDAVEQTNMKLLLGDYNARAARANTLLAGRSIASLADGTEYSL